MEVSRTTEEIIKERDRWVEMQRHAREQQEEMAAVLEKKRLEEEERIRMAQEKKQQRIAMEAARRAEKEARKKREEEDRKKREEEAKRQQPEQPEPGKEPGKEPAAGEEKGPWMEVKLKPNYLKDFPFNTPRPRFQSLGQGAVAGVLFVPYPHKGKLSGFVVKDLEKSIAVDTNADGKPDKHLPPDGGVVVLKIAYMKDKDLPCAVEIRRNGGKLEYRRYGWVAGRFKDTNILVIDENSNTKYNEVGDDAVVVGNAKGAVVLGDLVDIKGELYEIKVEEDGSMLRLKPAKLPTGMLFLTKGYSGRGKLHYAVILGAIGKDNSLVSYELSDQRKAVPVPAGEYFIFAGMVATGNRSSVRIYGGSKTKNFKVETGKTAAPKWGAPGVIEFKYILNRDGTLEIHSTEFRLYGALGEQYLGWGPKEFLPRVQVRTEAGKMLAEKQFKHSSDFANYYPFELLVPVQKKLQVRIIGEPKFLGPCASEWK